MTDSVKSVVDYFNEYGASIRNTNSSETINHIAALIAAAQQTDRLWDDITALRARIAELEKDRPGVVTVEEMSKHIQAWKFVDAAPSTFGAYLMEKYPNGLIVQDKEGG